MTVQLAKLDQADLFLNTIKNVNFNLNCHRVGVIQSFDSIKQLANVSLVDKSIKLTGISSEELIDMPLLENCPVMIPKNIKVVLVLLFLSSSSIKIGIKANHAR